MRKLIKTSLLFLLITFMSCNDDDSGNIDNRFFKETVSDIYNLTGELVGTSTLTRKDNALKINFQTSNLIPDHAYTLWIMVVNKPENCEGVPCGLPDVFERGDQIQFDFLYVDGLVVSDDGLGIFSGNIAENDNTTSINNEMLGIPSNGGLWDYETAEVHLLLRSHGPVIPSMVSEQVNSYSGGCTDFLMPFSETPTLEGQCAEIQASVHLP